MFNVGPMELLVLCVVGLIVLGPEKLPNLARDAARMIRTLRELANGARTQLRDELGPEFADIDLRNLNPRTAVARVLLGDGTDTMNPAKLVREAFAEDVELPSNRDLEAPPPAPAAKPVMAPRPIPTEPPPLAPPARYDDAT